MREIISKLDDLDLFLKRIEEYLAGTLFSFVVISILGQIVLRYIFNSPMTWVEEVCSFLIIWITLLGGSILYKNDKNVKVDYFVKKLSRKTVIIINMFIYIVTFIVLLFIVKTGIRLLPIQYDISCTATVYLPKSFYTLPLVLAGLSMMFSTIKKFLMQINNLS